MSGQKTYSEEASLKEEDKADCRERWGAKDRDRERQRGRGRTKVSPLPDLEQVCMSSRPSQG